MSVQWIPWVTSAVTLWGMWEAGNQRSRAWIIGLANQVLWIATAVAFKAWGLLPLTCALIFVYSRNLVRWRTQEALADPSA